MANKIILIVLLSVSFIVSHAQITFFKTYSENGFDIGQGVVQLPDSSYVITGASSSFQDAPSRAFLLKVDSLGNYLWSQSYGGVNSDWGRRVLHVQNEGFLIAGYSNSFTSTADFDFYLVKTDENGAQLWENTYGTSDWERLWDAVLLADGGVFMVGETSGNISMEEDIFLVRTDEEGNEVWQQRIQTAQSDIAYSVINFSDTTVLIGGLSSNETDAKTGYLALIHIDGTLIWEKFYGDNGTATYRSIYVFEDHIYAVGSIIVNGEDQRDHWMTKLDNTGNIVYQNVDSRPEDDYLSNVIVRDENSLFITAWIDEDVYTNGPDLLFAKYHTDMYFNNMTGFFSGENPDECHQMIISRDGGAVLVGFGMDPVWTSGGSAITLIKLGPNEETPTEIISNQTLVNLTEVFDNTTFSIYPNPVEDDLHIIAPEDWILNATFELIDASGRIVCTGKAGTVLDLSKTASGLYLLRMQNNGESINYKVVKQ